MCKKFKGKYRIDSARLKGWDYSSAGYYFVTICVQDRKCVFGEVIGGKMILNDLGKIVHQFWQDIPDHFDNAELDEFVVMPNHVHGIVVLENNSDRMLETQHCCVSTKKSKTFYRLKQKSLPVIVRSFKSICTREINKINLYINFQWQPKYYDHIIRNEKSLENIRNYIRFNPQKWDDDRENK